VIQARVLAVLSFAALLVACGDRAEPAGGPGTGSGAGTASRAADQSSPKALAEAIFAAARSKDFASLATIVAPDADGEAKRVADVAGADEEMQASFVEYFGKGKVNGEVVTEGDTARVPILFGPEGTKEETFEMIRIDGKWYLQQL
jgi:hypothetical protein